MPHCSVAGQKKIFFIPTKQIKYFLTFMFLANAKLGRNLWWASIMPQCSFPLKSIQIPQSECKIIGIPDSGIAKVLWINLQDNVHDCTMHTQNHLLPKSTKYKFINSESSSLYKSTSRLIGWLKEAVIRGQNVSKTKLESSKRSSEFRQTSGRFTAKNGDHGTMLRLGKFHFSLLTYRVLFHWASP